MSISRHRGGTTLAQTYAAYTYTTNGLPATQKDARNNLTTYQYDGHDRKVKALYPTAADNVVFAYDLLSRKTGASYLDKVTAGAQISDLDGILVDLHARKFILVRWVYQNSMRVYFEVI